MRKLFERFIREEGAREKELILDPNILKKNAEIISKTLMLHAREESFGGNSGATVIEGREYPCLATRGFADSKTGEIRIFENIQSVAPEILQNNTEFIFYIAVSIDPDGRGLHFKKVLNVFFEEGFSELAKAHLKKTVEQFNETLSVT